MTCLAGGLFYGIAALSVFCFAMAGTAWAGYRDMKKEFDEYTPPVFHKENKADPATSNECEKCR